MKNVNCACGTYYNWNHNCGTESRSGHFLQLGTSGVTITISAIVGTMSTIKNFGDQIHNPL